MLHLTTTAYEEIKRLLAGQEKPDGGLRIGVIQRSNACGGTSFTLNFVEEPAAGEKVLTVQEIRLMMEPTTYDLLSGYVLDFSEGMFGGGFRFIDRSTSATCRCGKAIAI